MEKWLLFIGLSLSATLMGQDIHFTQVDQFLLIQNPANTGFFDGWERAGIGHKSQWVNSGANYRTTTASADFSLFRKRNGEGTSWGLGLYLYNDKAGDANFGTKAFAFSTSVITQLAKKHKLALGLQAGIGQRSGDFSRLVFSSQFNGQNLDPGLNSGEFDNIVSFIYPDFSVGGIYQYGGGKNSFYLGNRAKFTAGIAYHHLTRPTLKYRINGTEKLYAKWAIHGSFSRDITGTNNGFEFSLNQFIQGPHTETNIGGLLRYYLSRDSKITGFKQTTYLAFGAYYRHKDAIAPVVKINYKGFNLGLSYDMTTSAIGNAGRAGSFEIALVYTNKDFALFKRQRF